MIHTCRIKDNMTPNFLAIKELIAFDNPTIVYRVFNKLCPENIGNKFHQRSYHSRYNIQFSRNFLIPKYRVANSKMKYFSRDFQGIFCQISWGLKGNLCFHPSTFHSAFYFKFCFNCWKSRLFATQQIRIQFPDFH